MQRSTVRSVRVLWAYVVCSLAAACVERPGRAVVRAPSAATSATVLDADTDAPSDAVAEAATDGSTDEVPHAEAPAEPPAEERAPTWTDRANVEALARDCNYGRATDDESQDEDPLKCTYQVYEQSCAPGSCNDDVNAPCRRRCARSCTGCDARCRAQCTQCHARCADAACRERCAVTCAGCLHGCTEARDACYSGACGRLYGACEARIRREFRARCAGPCTRCTNRCTDSSGQEDGECIRRCAQRGGCTRELAGICSFAGPQFGAPGTEDN